MSAKEIIGIIGGVILALAFFPQIFQTIKTKNTRGISFAMYIIYFIGVTGLVIYSAFPEGNQSPKDYILIPILVSNSVIWVATVIIGGYKFYNVWNCKEKDWFLGPILKHCVKNYKERYNQIPDEK